MSDDSSRKVKKRWPKNAEASRATSLGYARDIRRMVREAQEQLKLDPLRCEILLADIADLAGRVELLMELAKQGTEAADDD